MSLTVLKYNSQMYLPLSSWREEESSTILPLHIAGGSHQQFLGESTSAQVLRYFYISTVISRL